MVYLLGSYMYKYLYMYLRQSIVWWGGETPAQGSMSKDPTYSVE